MRRATLATPSRSAMAAPPGKHTSPMAVGSNGRNGPCLTGLASAKARAKTRMSRSLRASMSRAAPSSTTPAVQRAFGWLRASPRSAPGMDLLPLAMIASPQVGWPCGRPGFHPPRVHTVKAFPLIVRTDHRAPIAESTAPNFPMASITNAVPSLANCSSLEVEHRSKPSIADCRRSWAPSPQQISTTLRFL